MLHPAWSCSSEVAASWWKHGGVLGAMGSSSLACSHLASTPWDPVHSSASLPGTRGAARLHFPMERAFPSILHPKGPMECTHTNQGWAQPRAESGTRGGPGCFHDAQSCPAQLLFCFNKSAVAGPAQPPAHAVQQRLGSQLDAEKGMYSGGQAGWAAERKKTAAMKTCSLCKEPWKGCAAGRAAGWQ